MLAGSEAFAELSRAIRGEASFNTPFADPPFERLRFALKNQDVSPVDLAVLIRHALRYETLERGWSVSFNIDFVDADILQNAGLIVTENGEEKSVTAAPWNPEWLSDAKMVPTDQGANENASTRPLLSTAILF